PFATYWPGHDSPPVARRDLATAGGAAEPRGATTRRRLRSSACQAAPGKGGPGCGRKWGEGREGPSPPPRSPKGGGVPEEFSLGPETIPAPCSSSAFAGPGEEVRL